MHRRRGQDKAATIPPVPWEAARSVLEDIAFRFAACRLSRSELSRDAQRLGTELREGLRKDGNISAALDHLRKYDRINSLTGADNLQTTLVIAPVPATSQVLILTPHGFRIEYGYGHQNGYRTRLRIGDLERLVNNGVTARVVSRECRFFVEQEARRRTRLGW